MVCACAPLCHFNSLHPDFEWRLRTPCTACSELHQKRSRNLPSGTEAERRQRKQCSLTHAHVKNAGPGLARATAQCLFLKLQLQVKQSHTHLRVWHGELCDRVCVYDNVETCSLGILINTHASVSQSRWTPNPRSYTSAAHFPWAPPIT